MLKVVPCSFPKYLGIILLLWGCFCTAAFPIKWDKNEKNLKKYFFPIYNIKWRWIILGLDTLPTNFEYWYIPSKSALIMFSKTV